MSARITKILGAKPLPVGNTAVVPDGAGLLESLLEDCYEIGCEQEV